MFADTGPDAGPPRDRRPTRPGAGVRSSPPGYDVAILGAGPAGLMAAWHLARRGLRVVVIEARRSVGGLAASFEVAGVRVDHGSHRLHSATAPAILAELRSLLGGDLQIRARRGRIRLGDRWLRFPLEPGDLLRHAPVRLTVGAAADLLVRVPAARRRATGGDTFSDVVRNRLGSTVLEAFYRPYARKLWGLDPDHLSGDLARRRVALRNGGDLVRRILGGRHPAAGTYLYPRGGFGRIPEVLAEAARAAGAEVRLGDAVTEVRGGAVTTVAGRRVRATTVASTLPLPLLASLGGAPAELREAAATLRYRGLVLCYLALECRRYTPWEAHYLPDPGIAPVRVTEPTAYRDDPDDPPGRTVLCAEIPCDESGAWWDAPDGEIAGRVAADLVRIGLPAIEPVEVHVRRLPRVYPVPVPGTAEVLEALDWWATTAAGVVPFGRHGWFLHDNTHHALEAGAALAACVTEAGVDHGAWDARCAILATRVVED